MKGIPLGVPRLEFDCPEGGGERRNKPPEQRKSAHWLRGWRDSFALAAEAGDIEGVHLVWRIPYSLSY